MYRQLLNWLTYAPDVPSEIKRASRVLEPGVHVYYWDGATPVPHQFRDISLTGAYLYTSERWYPGTIVTLLLQKGPALDVGAEATGRVSVSVPARVVWHGADGVALEFLFRSPGDQQVLVQLIGGPHASRANGGQALIEFILVFPLLFLLIVNAVNFGAFLFSWITVANAARAGSQYYALGSAAISTPSPATAAQVTALVTNDISSLPDRSSLVVRVCKNNNGTVACTGAGASVPPADPEPLTYISATVDVTYTYQPLIPLWNFSGLGIHATLPPTTIHRRGVMRMLQ